MSRPDRPPLTVVLVHGAFANSSQLDRRGRASAGRRHPGDRPRGSAARHHPQLRLSGRLVRPDPRAGPRRRPLLRGCGDLQRRPRRRTSSASSTSPPSPRMRAGSGRHDGHLEGQRPGDGLVPLRYPAGAARAPRARGRSGHVPRPLRGRSPDPAAAVLAATQRPVAASAFSEPGRTPRLAVPPLGRGRHRRQGGRCRRDALDGRRARATVTEVAGSHVIMVSQPPMVADVILTAVRAVG